MNVVYVTADSLRADHVSYFDPDSPAHTPNVDALASEGAAFTTAIANGPYTVLSAPSMLTGEYHPAITRDTPTLAESMQATGYRTGGFCTNVQIVGQQLSEMELTRGFDHFTTLLNEVRERAEVPLERGAGHVGRGAERLFGDDSAVYRTVATLVSHLPVPLAVPTPHAETVNRHAVEWFDQGPDGTDTFVWLFNLDTHEPWLPPTADGEVTDRLTRLRSYGLNRKYRYFKSAVSDREIEQLHDLYVESVEYWDRQIGRLRDDLLERGHDDTVFVITSDHGELFGEHGEVGHPDAPWDELLRVPVVIAGPGIDSVDIDKVVSNADVVATLADLAGTDPPRSCRGRSLRPYWEGSELATDRPEGALTILQSDPLEISYRTSDYRYVRRQGGERLYAVDDPTDIADRQPETTAELATEVGQLLAGVPVDAATTGPVDGDGTDAEVSDRLRALGYLDDE